MSEISMTNKLWDPRRKALQNALKAVRLKSGMTQKNLSALLGKPQSYVSKYENGERRIDFIEVLEICEVLHLPLVQLTDPLECAQHQCGHGLVGFTCQ